MLNIMNFLLLQFVQSWHTHSNDIFIECLWNKIYVSLPWLTQTAELVHLVDTCGIVVARFWEAFIDVLMTESARVTFSATAVIWQSCYSSRVTFVRYAGAILTGMSFTLVYLFLKKKLNAINFLQPFQYQTLVWRYSFDYLWQSEKRTQYL